VIPIVSAKSGDLPLRTATEITEGLARLGILHQTTLPYSPYANGKQETLWGSVEGRLMAMLEGVDDLSLAQLNAATQAWVEQDYNRKHHSEINDTPLARFLAGPSVTRPCPNTAALRLAFTRTERRTLRRSDGTAVIEGRRFEVPNQYRHLATLEVRFAAWDLTEVHLVDPHTGTVLCRLFPQDKAANASGQRRGIQPIATDPGKPSPPPAMPPPATPARGLGPLLERMLDRQATTGLPPAYLPKDEGEDA